MIWECVKVRIEYALFPIAVPMQSVSLEWSKHVQDRYFKRKSHFIKCRHHDNYFLRMFYTDLLRWSSIVSIGGDVPLRKKYRTTCVTMSFITSTMWELLIMIVLFQWILKITVHVLRLPQVQSYECLSGSDSLSWSISTETKNVETVIQ